MSKIRGINFGAAVCLSLITHVILMNSKIMLNFYGLYHTFIIVLLDLILIVINFYYAFK